MAINVGSAIAYLELDTSGFKEAIRGAGEDLESFSSSSEVIIAVGDTMEEVSLSAQGLNMSLQDTAVAVSNMVISIASSIMEFKICLSELKEAIIEVMEAVKDLADALLEDLVNALNKVRDLVKSGIFDLLYDGIMEVCDALSSLISQASKIVILEEALKKLTKAIEDTLKAARDLSISFDEMKNKIELLAGAVLELKNKIDELTEAEKADIIQANNLKNAITSLTEVITGLRENVELCLIPFGLFAAALKLCDNEAKALAKTINEELKPALDSLKEISIGLSIELSGKIKTATEQAGDSAKDLGSKLEDSAKKSEESTGVLASIRKALDPFISKVKEIIEVVEGWIEKFKKVIEVIKTIKELLSNFSKLEKVASILEKIISVAEKIIAPIEKIIEVVKKVIGAFDSLEAAASVFGEIAAAINPEVLIIIGIIAGIGLIVYEVIKHWDELKAYFKGLWKDFKEAAINIVDGFVEGIKEFGHKAWEAITWLGDQIVNFFTGLFGIKSPSKVFGEFGGFIIEGLVNGLTDGLGTVMKAIGNIGNSIIDKFKSLLGINSPSKVFAEYGGFIGEGLIQGIDNQEGAITTKFTGIANKIKDLGNVKPEFNGLNNMALSGAYGSNAGLGTGSSKQFNFTPNITMHISVADTGAKGTAQLTSELKTMAQNAIKNSMIDEFMADALRL